MEKFNLKGVTSGILTSVIITSVLIFLTALIFYFSDIPETAMVYVSNICLFIGVFFGGFLLSKNTDTGKGISGILMGVGVFLILFFLTLIFGNGIGMSVLVSFLVCLLASMFGVIMGN